MSGSATTEEGMVPYSASSSPSITMSFGPVSMDMCEFVDSVIATMTPPGQSSSSLPPISSSSSTPPTLPHVPVYPVIHRTSIATIAIISIISMMTGGLLTSVIYKSLRKKQGKVNH